MLECSPTSSAHWPSFFEPLRGRGSQIADGFAPASEAKGAKKINGRTA